MSNFFIKSTLLQLSGIGESELRFESRQALSSAAMVSSRDEVERLA